MGCDGTAARVCVCVANKQDGLGYMKSWSRSQSCPPLDSISSFSLVSCNQNKLRMMDRAAAGERVRALRVRYEAYAEEGVGDRKDNGSGDLSSSLVSSQSNNKQNTNNYNMSGYIARSHTKGLEP